MEQREKSSMQALISMHSSASSMDSAESMTEQAMSPLIFL
jgi:hypothetical protein